MANTFDAVHQGAHERSSAFLPLERPAEQLDSIIEQAQLHRGSLREQDGYTIPFREGGSVRIRIVEPGEDQAQAGLQLTVDAPTVERLEHIQRVIEEETLSHLRDGGVVLDWAPEA